jgi:hypothetical protein
LLIDEQPMTSKYWTSESHKGIRTNSGQLSEQPPGNGVGCGHDESGIEENDVGRSIKANNIELRKNNNSNMQSHQSDATKSFSISSSPPPVKRRPDSLKLSFEYGSTSDLAASPAPGNGNVNQSKSLSDVVAGNKSHHDGKKSTSYDFWMNENVLKVNDNGGESKKLDLPGRVSFR